MNRNVPDVGVSALLRFAWPSVASFVCNSAFRVNDQFWVGGLGAQVQAALAASTFVMILNFAVYFLIVAGTLPQVARLTGAGDMRGRDEVVAHAISLQVVIGALHGCIGWLAAPWIAQLLGLEGAVAAGAVEYLRMGFLLTIPMGLAALVDNVFFGVGDTRTPLLLQLLAVGLNFLLNPIFIYGVAPWDGFELLRDGSAQPWMGIGGAALATGLSRLAAVSLGFVLLWRRHRVRWWPTGALIFKRLRSIVVMGAPSAISVAIYAGVYFGLLRLVFEPLPTAVLAGFGLGFNAFEGVAFPFYLGLAVAGASLVGRCLGAGDPAAISGAIRSLRILGLATGLGFAAIFMFLAPVIVPLFTRDEAVMAVSIQYVQVLALSQVFVALEVLSEKVLLGVGITRPALWISVPCNLLRIPLAAWLALHLGYGAVGIWWAINITTLLKALAFHLMVRREPWRADMTAAAA
ncbi:MAG: putative MATE family efflux protein [Planctomycetota bacterium]